MHLWTQWAPAHLLLPLARVERLAGPCPAVVDTLRNTCIADIRTRHGRNSDKHRTGLHMTAMRAIGLQAGGIQLQ